MNRCVLKVLHHPDSSGEPTPAFASDAEMALAEQLRHKLEQRSLEAANGPAPSQDPPRHRTISPIPVEPRLAGTPTS